MRMYRKFAMLSLRLHTQQMTTTAKIGPLVKAAEAVMETNSARKRFTEECWLRKHPEFHGCCCQCRFRLRAFPQATSTAMQNIWICIAFAEGADVAFVGNFQHGICELFDAISLKK